MKNLNPKLEEKNKKILFYLYLVLLFINAVAFLVYHASHPGKQLSLQLWEYTNSEVCKLISASILLPIILFFLESKFKLADTAAKNIEERRSAELQALRAERRAVIADTLRLWNCVYEIATDIRCCDLKNTDDKAIDKPLKAAYRIANAGEDVVNSWSFTFSNITLEEMDIFLEFFNIILKSCTAVAQVIKERVIADKELQVLQESLGVILISLKSIVHHPMIQIFKLSSDLLEDNSDAEKIQKRQKHIDNMKQWHDYIRSLEKEQNRLFSSVDDEAGDELRAQAEKFRQWITKNPGSPANEFKGFNEIFQKFNEVPRGKRFSAQCSYYSPEFVRFLADNLGFEYFVRELWRLSAPLGDRGEIR